MRWYKRDPDAFAFGTIGLTLQEVGAYTLILDAMYSRSGPLPDDDIYLRTIVRCHGNRWRAIKRSLILKGKIWISRGNLYAKRVGKELRNAREKSKKANEINKNGQQNIEERSNMKEERAGARRAAKFKTIKGGRDNGKIGAVEACRNLIDRLGTGPVDYKPNIDDHWSIQKR